MKTVFIALDFHLQNTKSSLFFIDILKEYFSDLIVVGANNAWYEIPRIKPDTIIIWQKIFTPQEIDSWQAKNIILIPMYDAVSHSNLFWEKYRNYKILCFSKKLFDIISKLNIDALYVQYYQKPIFDKLPQEKEASRNVFFWERSKKITWEIIKKLLGDNAITSIAYHTATNIQQRNESCPTLQDEKKYAITYSNWFSDQKAYIDCIKNSDLFFAPREQEGIGLSFIEAISFGCCVIGYNDSTMNEYITDGETGFIFSFDSPSNIVKTIQNNLTNTQLTNIRNQSIQAAHIGYSKWIESIPKIISFINKPIENYNPRISFFVFIKKRIRAEIRHIYKKMLVTHKKHIFIKLYAGLGNQLFQYAYGRYLEQNGYDVTFIQSASKWDLCEIFDTGKIDLIRTNSKLRLFFNKCIAKYFYHNYSTGFYQKAEYVAAFPSDCNHFTRENDYKQTEAYKKIIGCDSVSIHIRGGDYKTEEQYAGICTEEYYKDSIQKILNIISNPHFFIFTNDDILAHNILDSFINKIQAINKNIKITFINDFVISNDLASDPGFNLFLMSCCNYNIISNSTYSWWGARLSQGKKRNVIYPSEWVKNDRHRWLDIIPDEWRSHSHITK